MEGMEIKCERMLCSEWEGEIFRGGMNFESENDGDAFQCPIFLPRMSCRNCIPDPVLLSFN